MEEKEINIVHVNPNCLGARYCKPHGEVGPVEHYPEIFEVIRAGEIALNAAPKPTKPKRE